MKMMNLGNANLAVSRVGIGCMRMGGCTVQQADAFVKETMDMGVNFFDHADIYAAGEAERIFGQVLAETPGLREKLVLQSKAGIVPGVMYDNSKEHLINAADGILKRLQTEYLDVLLIHRPDALVEPDEVAEAFDELHRAGKVRYLGVSNHNSMQMELLASRLNQPLVTDQLQFSITNSNMVRSGMEVNMETDGAYDRDGSVLDYCRLKNITVQTWSPFQYGMFEGAFIGSEKYPKLNEVLSRIASGRGVTPTTLSAAWILRHPAKMQLISGSMKAERQREICQAAELTLTKEEWYEIYLAAGHILP